MFTCETWKLNVSFSHLIGHLYNDTSSLRQTHEVNNEKVNRAETGKCTVRKKQSQCVNDKLVNLFNGKIEESNNSF